MIMKKNIFAKNLCALIVFLFVALPFAAAQEAAQADVSGNDAVKKPESTEASPVAEAVAKTAENAATKETPVISAEDAAAYAYKKNFFIRFGTALGVVAGQVLLSWLIWLLFKYLSQKIINAGGDKIKPLTIRKFKLLSAKQIINAIVFVLKIFRYMVL